MGIGREATCVRFRLIALDTLKEANQFGLVTPSVVDSDLSEPEGAFEQLDSETKTKIMGMKTGLTTKRENDLPKRTWKQKIRAAANIMIGKA